MFAAGRRGRLNYRGIAGYAASRARRDKPCSQQLWGGGRGGGLFPNPVKLSPR